MKYLLLSAIGIVITGAAALLMAQDRARIVDSNASKSSVPVASDTPLPPQSAWRVDYVDALQGQVTGQAVVDKNGKTVRVKMEHPTSFSTSQAEGEIQRSGDELTIVLRGRQLTGDPGFKQPNLLGMNRIPFAPEPGTVAFRVKGVGGGLPVRARGVADADTLTLKLKKSGDDWQGQWSYRADSLTERERHGGGRVGRFALLDEPEVIGQQSGTERWSPKKSRIYAVVCLEDQMKRDRDYVIFKYPKKGESVNRRLFVVGDNLPAQYSDPAKLESGEPQNASYSVRYLKSDYLRNPEAPQEVGKGWTMLTRDMPDEQAKKLREKDTLILNVRLKYGIKPGKQSFKLNDDEASWTLLFGDNQATISFARHPREDQWESTPNVYIPEQLRVMIMTRVDLPLNTIELVLGHNDKPVKIGNAQTIAAEKMPKTKEDKYEGRRYLTEPFNLKEIPLQKLEKSEPTLEANRDLEARTGDMLFAMPADQGLVIGDMARAKVNVTPAELGLLWKEYLKKAADCAGIPVENWSTISNKKAEEITNFILFDASVTKIGRFEIGTDLRLSPKEEKVRVTIADHAAAMMLRDEFVRAMSEMHAEFAKIQGPVMMRGFYETLKPIASDPNNPLGRIKVTAPNGHEVGASAIFMPDWISEYFKISPAQANAWSEQALQQALDRYRDAMAESIRMAKEPTDCDVEGLLKITAYGFGAVAERLMPRLMKLENQGEPPRAVWAPDLAARSAVQNLGVVGEAIRAQKEYADIDTNIAVTVASLVAMPYMTAETILSKAIALGVDLAGIAVTGVIEIPDYLQKRDDVRFARGASAVLGTEQLDEAEAREVPTWQAALSVAGAVLGAGMSGAELVSAIKQARRATEVCEKLAAIVQKGGLRALGELDENQRRLVLAYMADAGNTRARAGVETLTNSQRQAAETLEKLHAEAGAARALEPLDPHVPRPHVTDPERAVASGPEFGGTPTRDPLVNEPHTTRPPDRNTGLTGAVDEAGPKPHTDPTTPPVRNAEGAPPPVRGPDNPPRPTSTSETPTVRNTPDNTSAPVRNTEGKSPPTRGADNPPRSTSSSETPTIRTGGDDPLRPNMRGADNPSRPMPVSESPTVRLPAGEKPPTEVTMRTPPRDNPNLPPSRTNTREATTRMPEFDPPPAAHVPAERPTTRFETFDPPKEIIDDLPDHIPPHALPDRAPRPHSPALEAPRAAPHAEPHAPAHPAGEQPLSRIDPGERLPRDSKSIAAHGDEVNGRAALAEFELSRLKKKPNVTPEQLTAAKDRLSDLQQRGDVLAELEEEARRAGKPLKLSEDDLNWLSGRRTELTSAEKQAADKLLAGDFKKNWKEVTGALSHDNLSKIDMQKLLVRRKEVVDQMLSDAIKKVEADIFRETGVAAKIERKAFGSTNLTSDYDISVGGVGAERVVGEFNRKFRKTFGREPGTMFDTNIYTDPVYDLFSAENTMSGRLRQMSPLQRDEMRQFMYDQMTMAKYTSDAHWDRHVRQTLNSVSEEERPLMRQMLQETKARETAARLRIKERLGIDPQIATGDDVLRVTNDLYSESLERIDQMRSMSGKLSRIDNAAGQSIEVPKLFKGTQFERDIQRLEQLKAAGNNTAAKRLKADLDAQLAGLMRNEQGHALYYASEAYQGEGTIGHVVKELQASKRPIDPDVLMGRKSNPPSSVKLSEAHYVTSFNENRSNLFKELGAANLGDDGRLLRNFSDPVKYEKAAQKSSKYFIRQLDAAHNTGIKLPEVLGPELAGVIRETAVLEAARGSPAEFAAALKKMGLKPEEYVDKVLAASDRLAGPIIAKSPIRKLAPEVSQYYKEVEETIRSIPGVQDPFPVAPSPKAHVEFEHAPPVSPHAPPPGPVAGGMPPVVNPRRAAEDLIGTRVDPVFTTPKVEGPIREIPLPDPAPRVHADGSTSGPVIKDGKFIDAENKSIPVGKKLGEGQYVSVYESGNDEVVKFVKPTGKNAQDAAAEGARAAMSADDMKRTPQEVAQMLYDNSQLLKDRGIRQLEVTGVQTKGTAYFTARKAGPEMQRFDYEKFTEVGRGKMIADGHWSEAHEMAVAELFHDMAKKDLFWEDAGLNNLYFEYDKTQKKLVAGILDQDRISDWNKVGPYMQGWRDTIAMAPGVQGIGSLNGVGLGKFKFENAEQFMAKMFEYKGWIKFDPHTGQMLPGLVDPKIIQNKFDIEKWIRKPPAKPTGWIDPQRGWKPPFSASLLRSAG